MPLETPGTPEGHKKPIHPWLVLLLAVCLPGAGHVSLGMPQRGLVFLFFMLLMGWITWHLTTDAHSFIGRHAGGILIYGLSVLDAYKWARISRAEYDAKSALKSGG